MQVSGAELIRNEQNLEFLRTCNRAVSEARGDYILLLNNDTVVHVGAIEAMLETFEQFGEVGAVCAQLRFADGTLQEAGGIGMVGRISLELGPWRAPPRSSIQLSARGGLRLSRCVDGPACTLGAVGRVR